MWQTAMMPETMIVAVPTIAATKMAGVITGQISLVVMQGQ